MSKVREMRMRRGCEGVLYISINQFSLLFNLFSHFSLFSLFSLFFYFFIFYLKFNQRRKKREENEERTELNLRKMTQSERRRMNHRTQNEPEGGRKRC